MVIKILKPVIKVDNNKTVIGASWLNGTISNYFGGRVDDVRIFSTVLTTNQIKELYDLAN